MDLINNLALVLAWICGNLLHFHRNWSVIAAIFNRFHFVLYIHYQISNKQRTTTMRSWQSPSCTLVDLKILVCQCGIISPIKADLGLLYSGRVIWGWHGLPIMLNLAFSQNSLHPTGNWFYRSASSQSSKQQMKTYLHRKFGHGLPAIFIG